MTPSGPITWAALARECAAPTGGLPAYPGVLMRQGMQGESIRQFQRCLNRIAARQQALSQISEDGVFGQATWCAVTTFQRLFNLSPDGVVGPLTWAALARECA